MHLTNSAIYGGLAIIKTFEAGDVSIPEKGTPRAIRMNVHDRSATAIISQTLLLTPTALLGIRTLKKCCFTSEEVWSRRPQWVSRSRNERLARNMKQQRYIWVGWTSFTESWAVLNSSSLTQCASRVFKTCLSIHCLAVTLSVLSVYAHLEAHDRRRPLTLAAVHFISMIDGDRLFRFVWSRSLRESESCRWMGENSLSPYEIPADWVKWWCAWHCWATSSEANRAKAWGKHQNPRFLRLDCGNEVSHLLDQW